MDVEELYDEFGNYIGPDQSDSDSDSLQLPDLPKSAEVKEVDEPVPPQEPTPDASSAPADEPTDAIVLAEDKQLYPTAAAVFGTDTAVLVEEEDAQPLSEPLVAPVVHASSGLHESPDAVPPSRYSRAYLTSAVAPYPSLIRNIAVVGAIHSGKTSFLDMLFESTHEMPWENLDDRLLPVRYTDNRRDEQQLRVSLKTSAATLLLQTPRDKSYAFTLLDTPGHTDFIDEVVSALCLADAVLVTVDVAEGITLLTEKLLLRAASMRRRIVLMITKLDRLCLELRLPPNDAYHKIRHIIDSCNEQLGPFDAPILCPAMGNVVFSSANERVCFTLLQFARSYIASHGGEQKFPLTPEQLARRFWGNVYYNEDTRKFSDESLMGRAKRSFVSFILEPYYKLHTAVLSEDVEELTNFLSRNCLLSGPKRKGRSQHLNGAVSAKALNVNLKVMLKEVNSNCFGMGDLSGMTEALVNHTDSPVDAAMDTVHALRKVDWPQGDSLSDLQRVWRRSMDECNSDESAPLTAYVAKLVPDERGVRFDCLLRILSGRLRVGDEVGVLGHSYDELANREDVSTAVVSGIFLPCARFNIEVKEAVAGQVVLVRGTDQTINKSATIVSRELVMSHNALALRNISELLPPAVLKVAVEPVRPAELPKMVSSLRQCAKAYPGLVTKVEETGEHNLIGAGELYMDCVLRDLREAYGKVEVKVSDPVVPFAETVSEMSVLQCYADTPNGKNRIVMVAEPLEETMLEALEQEKLGCTQNVRAKLREYGWDALAAKSLWTFGPDPWRGPNALTNDVLVEEERGKAEVIRDSVVQGFCWATREGPLADEPVRGVKVRVLEMKVAEEEGGRSGAQVIPTARRVVLSSIVTASPRMMEPVNVVELVGETAGLQGCRRVVERRRGVVVHEAEVVGTRLRRQIVHLPVLDSFGLEADIRSLTHGTTFCVQMFDHWAVMPGDPMDKGVELRALEAARRHELARECMVKTRRRKGLEDEVRLGKYLDDPILAELAGENPELGRLME